MHCYLLWTALFIDVTDKMKLGISFQKVLSLPDNFIFDFFIISHIHTHTYATSEKYLYSHIIRHTKLLYIYMHIYID